MLICESHVRALSWAGEEGEPEYEVEKILQTKLMKGKKKFLVKWKGFDEPGDNTWEPIEHVEDTAAYETFLKDVAEQERERARAEADEKLEELRRTHEAEMKEAAERQKSLFERARAAAEEDTAQQLLAQADELGRRQEQEAAVLREQASALRDQAVAEAHEERVRLEAALREEAQRKLEEQALEHAERFAALAAEHEADKENASAESKAHFDAVMAAPSYPSWHEGSSSWRG